jgi:uncharacterized protein YbaR (Trm112 family)
MSDTRIILNAINEIGNSNECAFRVTNWLQENKIIEKNKSHCLLGLEDLGYKPSINYSKVVEYNNEILKFSTCGFESSTKKEVFNRMQFNTATKVCCPICNENRFEGNTESDFHQELVSSETLEMYYEFQDGFENWENEKETLINCPKCKNSSLVENYIYEPKIYFSNLAFYFWNWAELKFDFITELEEKIGFKMNNNFERI